VESFPVAGGLQFGLSSGTTSGFVEGQALFISPNSSAVTLATTGDYIDLTYTFTDTQNLLAGGTSSAIYTGLYNSGGVAPIAGTAGTSGNTVTLNTTAGSSYATGGTADWQGYISRITESGGTLAAYTRPQETGAGTTSANQELIGNNFGSGAYANPAGSQVGSSMPSTVTLTAANQYTVDYRLTLNASGGVTISDNLYSGVGTGGTDLSSQSVDTGSSLLTGAFDGLAIGVRNSGSSLNPEMDINQITVTEGNSVPEPNTLALLGGGMVLLQVARRRLQTRA
jgi:hypothetical protein